MSVQIILAQPLGVHRGRALDAADARVLAGAAPAVERLGHRPLGAGVEKGQRVAPAQVAPPRDAHLHAPHVALERGRAAVVDEHEVRVEVHV